MYPVRFLSVFRLAAFFLRWSFSVAILEYSFIAVTCFCFDMSRVAANRMLASAWFFLSSVHRSCSVTWYQFSLGWPMRFFAVVNFF